MCRAYALTLSGPRQHMPYYCYTRAILHFTPFPTSGTMPNPRWRACGGHGQHGGGAQVHTRVRQGGAPWWGNLSLHVRVQAEPSPPSLTLLSSPKPRLRVRFVLRMRVRQVGASAHHIHGPWSTRLPCQHASCPATAAPSMRQPPPPSPRTQRPLRSHPLPATALAIHSVVAGFSWERVLVCYQFTSPACAQGLPHCRTPLPLPLPGWSH